MVAVLGDEIAPALAGDIYCSVIEGCQEVYDLRRAQEWTVALTHWCEAQPDLVPYRGQCQVHRAEIMLLRGGWPDAADKRRRAHERLSAPPGHPAAGAALLPAGRAAPAARRRSATPRRPTGRPPLGPAAAAGSRAAPPGPGPARRGGGGDPPRVGRDHRSRRRAPAAGRRRRDHARGRGRAGGARAPRTSCRHRRGNRRAGPAPPWPPRRRAPCASPKEIHRPRSPHLRRAWTAWHRIEAPYEAAKVRVLIGQACRAPGDEDTALMEFDAAAGGLRRGSAPRPICARAEALARTDRRRRPAA